MKRMTLNQPLNGITFEEAFEEFIKSCEVKNLTSDTISFYNRCEKRFSEFFDITHACSEIDLLVYQDYVLYLKKDTSIKEITIKTLTRGLRAILYFCMERKYMESFKIKLLKVDEVLKEPYTDAELEILLQKPDMKRCSFAEYRTWVMENFLYGTALRISSVLNIKLEDVHLDSRAVTIRKTKQRKEQITNISLYLRDILEEYVKYLDKNVEYLFPNQFGTKFSKRGAEGAIAEYNKSRGVIKTSAHLFRHTFAKNWILKGGNIKVLQLQMGHKSRYMVDTYVNLYGENTQDIYDMYNPLDDVIQQKQKTLKMVKKRNSN